MEEGNSGSFSALQSLLKLSYSENPDDQQKAAISLSKAVEGVFFPAVSFGPLSHAISRLLPSKNRTVASYSAKALKNLLLDDALRSQVIVAGVPALVCVSLRQWTNEVLCLRELLGALQTLAWDKQCVKSILQADVISCLYDFSKSADQEVSVLALATLANICSYADTLLLSNQIILEALSAGLPSLVEYVRVTQKQRPQRFYAVAAIANASSHPRLASILNQNGGLELCRDLERQSLANLHLLGSRMGDCAQTAVYHLSSSSSSSSSDSRKENNKNSSSGSNGVNYATAKYRFKYGTKPVMELSLASYSKYSGTLWCCFGTWLIIILFTFSPLIRGGGGGGV